ncbi:hypothetical protein TSOC_014032 [Tetrabaena socialis]|uniref:Uncharacterized protein n=1 Tax=Tetrabaena socialis TaxID=47790 RepID=A0A2J7ZIR9_9CHLO|nr:hypothetical protein TSOC_014032 [Tetrabaena socialis]|eukprot:PNH00161.1 hypothetical protein TSOC_014032 [Tetrabaena socialis]
MVGPGRGSRRPPRVWVRVLQAVVIALVLKFHSADSYSIRFWNRAFNQLHEYLSRGSLDVAVCLSMRATMDRAKVGRACVRPGAKIRFWSPDAAYSNFSVSADNVTWTAIRSFMNSSLLDAMDIYLPTITSLRYLRLRHQVKEDADWRKVYVWGLDAYDEFGQWGPPPPPVPHPLTLRSMLGVNGIWGWGFNKFSKELAA